MKVMPAKHDYTKLFSASYYSIFDLNHVYRTNKQKNGMVNPLSRELIKTYCD